LSNGFSGTKELDVGETVGIGAVVGPAVLVITVSTSEKLLTRRRMRLA